MPTIVFQGNRGKVVRVDDPVAQANLGSVSVDGSPIGYDSRKSIVTRVTVAQAANVQFLHTIGAFVYIYVFGDRIGQMTLSGLSFADPCGGGAADGTGLEQMMKWYKQNRVSESGKSLRVQIGKTAVDGFVTTSGFEVVEADTGIGQWNVTLQTLPER